MTDKEKLDAIRAEVQKYIYAAHKAHTNITEGNFAHLLSFIDSLQEEPVKDRFAFKAIPRLLEMIEPTDRAKSYVTKLADAFDSEGYYTDAKIVRESLKIMNGEKVAMATMDDKPVSEKKCMFTKDNYTDEDRKVLCEDCKERCAYAIAGVISTNAQIKEEPVSESIDFEQELYKAFGQIKDFTLAISIAKRFYDMGRKQTDQGV